jgi:Mrp family chromosome partitioning ATPase
MVRDPESPAARAYRSVRASIRHARQDTPIRSVLIAEPGVGDQTGHPAANIALSFALNQDQTVLIDTNTAEPIQHHLFHTPPGPGLAEWLAGVNPQEASPAAATGIDGLALIPAGEASALGGRSGADLLNAERCSSLIQSLGHTARFIVFHAPALPFSSEALTVAAEVDAVVLVVRSGVTKRTDAQRAREALDRVGANVLGAILTDAS